MASANEILPFVLRNPVSSLTHLGWCLWAVWVTGLLWKLARGNRWRQLSVGCFGLSMVLLYGASGTYHAIPSHFSLLVMPFHAPLAPSISALRRPAPAPLTPLQSHCSRRP